MKTRRTRFYKAIFFSTHPSGSFFTLINGNSHSFERLIDIMLRWSRSKFCFYNMNLDNDGTEDEPPLPRRRSKNSEFLDLDAKIVKSGIEEVKTLNSNEPNI